MPLRQLGMPYSLERDYPIKPYPVCGPAQPLIDAVKVIRKQPTFGIDDILSIEADPHYFSLLRPNPWDEDSAGYSGAFVIAATLMHGDIWINQVTDEAISDPRIASIMSRVSHRPSSERDLDRVAIRLRGGEMLEATIAHGDGRATTAEAAIAKFRRCAQRVLTGSDVDELMKTILQLDVQPTVNRMMNVAMRHS